MHACGLLVVVESRLRLRELLAVGATSEMLPDTPNSAITVRLSRAVAELGISVRL